MRKILLYMSFCFLLFSSLPVHAAQVEALSGEAVITSNTLNVRSGPSVEDEIRGTLKKDQVVEIVGFVEPDWYVIDYAGQPGYINGEYLTFTPTEELPSEEIDQTDQTGQENSTRTYLILGLSVGIFLVGGLMIYTFVSMRSAKDAEDEEADTIPVTDHDDTNMHLGEVSYDTYRLDIDPSFFETTTIVPQPESITEEERARLFDTESDDSFTGSDTADTGMNGNDKASDIRTIDDKLEQASAQIAALQKEVEELRRQKP